MPKLDWTWGCIAGCHYCPPRVRRDVPEEDPQIAMRRDTFTAEEWHTFMLSMLVSTEPMAARFRSLFSWL